MFARRTGWQSTSNRFTLALEERRRSGQEALDLTESNPTRCGFRYPEALLDRLRDARALAYAPEAQGMPAAREAIRDYYRESGAELASEQLFLTTSTSEGYSWVFRLLCDPGDEVLIPAPSYPLFEYLASIQDVAPVRYPLFYDHGWHVDVHALEQALTPQARAILVVSPNNPTGSYLREEELAQMNRLCADRGLALVVDEVFLDFALDGRRHASLARNREALTFTLSGLSKIAALPQMKVAWIAVTGPERVAQEARQRLEIIADTYLSMSTPSQLATPGWLESRHPVQAEIRERIADNLATLDAAIAKAPAVERLEVEGGWYAVLRVPRTASDEELAIALLQEQGVVVHPGHFYDFPTEGYLVASLITPTKAFAIGSERLAEALSRRFR